MKLLFIGGGNMGGAVFKAISQNFPNISLSLVERNPQNRQRLAQEVQCTVFSQIKMMDSSHTEAVDFFVLAVKPQNSKQVMHDLAPYLKKEQVIISFMAGVSIKTMQHALEHAKIVRLMPNLPCLIRKGMSVFYADPAVSEEECQHVKSFFKTCGNCLQVQQEDAIDAATAVSGSGPAYLFYLAEHAIQTAVDLGFSTEEAELLVQQTFKGATLLWEQEKKSAETLREQVTSQGGTTEAALDFFEAQQLGDHLQQGIQKAYQRAKDLAN